MATSPCIPSESFKAFLAQYVAKELCKSMRRSKETVGRELWAAANYDNFQVTGTFRALVDALGAPAMSAAPYRNLILDALNQIIHGATLLGTREDPVYHRAREVMLEDPSRIGVVDCAVLLQADLGVNFDRASRLVEAMEGDVLTPPDADGKRHLAG